MITRLFIALILVGISFTKCGNLRIVEGNREAASKDNDIAVEWADLDEEIALGFNANNGFGNTRQYNDGHEKFEVERNFEEDGTATLEDAIDDNDDSELEIHINSVEEEDEELEDYSEEGDDEGDDPCLSEPDLPECKAEEEEEPPTIM